MFKSIHKIGQFMKYTLLSLMLVTTPVLAMQDVPKSEVEEVTNKATSPEYQAKLQRKVAEAASKFLYVSRDCEMPIDPEKFKNWVKLKAFSEGYTSIEGVDWETVKREAHINYGKLKIEAPEGELCKKYKAFLKDKYQWLKDN